MHCRGPALGTAWHSFDEPATCNLRKVQVSGKRLMRATREYEPLFHAIKQFPRTHGIMGRAGGNGNFVDKIVVAVRTYVRTYGNNDLIDEVSISACSPASRGSPSSFPYSRFLSSSFTTLLSAALFFPFLFSRSRAFSLLLARYPGRC
ncbi:hypothetical protein X777_02617 [Ooceraea biroi]|uniref:Uncharacterized protein n=1 Tax=Ooceraea biroi TaxID=2015173 RepID=A0A026WNW1_OOCBI|nr:hypothetical protein X777_02617 [Ooceraea biroi]